MANSSAHCHKCLNVCFAHHQRRTMDAAMRSSMLVASSVQETCGTINQQSTIVLLPLTRCYCCCRRLAAATFHAGCGTALPSAADVAHQATSTHTTAASRSTQGAGVGAGSLPSRFVKAPRVATPVRAVPGLFQDSGIPGVGMGPVLPPSPHTHPGDYEVYATPRK